LARAFLETSCSALGRAPMAVSPGAAAALLRHRWPGNVRELKNIIDLLASTVQERVLQAWHVEEVLGGGASRASSPQVEPLSRDSTTPFRAIDDEVRELEAQRMREALEAAAGVKKRAAELISMPLRTFNTKYKLYGLGSP
jgi:DNA-binding NtrC family response regulator